MLSLNNVQSVPRSLWKICSILGVGLIATGITAGYVDIATNFGFDFISRHFGMFILAILVGVVLAFVGLIGWAKQQKSGARVRLAGLVFAAPWIAGMIGYPIAGDNIHGPAALLLLVMVPAAILAVVLLIMAGY
jgi:hypothetical protein